MFYFQFGKGSEIASVVLSIGSVGLRDVIRKKRDYVGKVPKLGGWV